MPSDTKQSRRVRFDVITIFPEVITSYTTVGVLGRAVRQRLVEVRAVPLREFADDRHRTVDDRPYGGGPGMVMKLEPIVRALRACGGAHAGTQGRARRKAQGKRVILLSPRGKPFTQASARRLGGFRQLTFIAGRYEGIDERVTHFIDETLSLGPFILSGGELAALACIDAIARLIPGVLGNEESPLMESFSRPQYREHPHYTRPPSFTFNGTTYRVPKVLLEGDHARIAHWRTVRARTKPSPSSRTS